MEISYSSWPWHRSDATALAGYANMMMMMMMTNLDLYTTIRLGPDPNRMGHNSRGRFDTVYTVFVP